MYHHVIEWWRIDDGNALPDVVDIGIFLSNSVRSESHLYCWYLQAKHVANPHCNSHGVSTLTSTIALSTRSQPMPLLLAHHRRKAYMVRNWKRESIPKATGNVRMLWRTKYKDKVPTVHLSTKSTKNQMNSTYGREINQLSRRLATNWIALLTVMSIPVMSVDLERVFVFSGCRRTITWKLGVNVVSVWSHG